MATERRVSWLIQANISNWSKNLNKAQRRMDRFGRKMQRAGRSLTQNVTMPLGAAAGAAVKMASDFESSLGQAQAQAALTAQQVSFIGDAAKRTAQRTGEGTDEIIEAYKFAISAGKNLAESQEIVTAAAEASAAGFGEQRDLVRTTTTALEAYSGRLEDGREFMDLLVGSAQVMELEVSKLSGAMQRNVGVANNLGIGLDELLAGIGSVSEIMGDAQRGGRAMAAMLNSLLSPSAEAKEAIAGVFGSLSNMRQALREDGLLSAMNTLRDRLESTSEEGLGLIFSQRALEAALNLTNNEGQRTNEILQNMGNTAGSTKSAFDAVSDTTENNFREALRAVQVSAIELGEIMLPLANNILESVKTLAQQFQALSKELKVQAVLYAGLAAAAGPVLIVFGKMTRALAALLSPAFLAKAAVLALFSATVVTGQWFVDNWRKIEKGFANALLAMKISAQKMVRAVIESFKWLFNTMTTLAPPELLSDLFGIDLSEEALDFLGVNQAIDNMDKAISNGKKQLKQGIKEYNDIEWGSITESAKNAYENTKSAIVNGLQGILNSSQIQGLIDDINSMISDSMGGGIDTDVGGGTEGEESASINFARPPDITKATEDWKSNIRSMAPAVQEVGSITEIALQGSQSAWDSFVETSKAAGFDFVNFLSGQVSNAIAGFADNLGKMFVGAGDEFATGLEQILLVVVDFAKRLAQLLIGIGTAIAFVPGMQGNSAAFIAGGAALMALASATGAVIQKNIDQRRERSRETSVNDALIRSDGSVVKFHPDDNLLAMKDFSKLGMAGGGSQTLNNNLFLDGSVVWRNQRRVNYKRGR